MTEKLFWKDAYQKEFDGISQKILRKKLSEKRIDANWSLKFKI